MAAPTHTALRGWRSVFALCIPLFITASLRGEEPTKERECSLGLKFALVQGTPVFFAVDETRVSDFATFVRESGYAWNEKTFFPQTPDHPVVNVNIVDAVTFCEWLTKRDRAKHLITGEENYRLPSNSEWDIVSGANNKETKEVFPWGTQWPPPEHAGNFNTKAMGVKDDGWPFTAPVGSFAAAANGLHDLAGNVWEWAMDGDAGKDGYASLRGGSWAYFRKECLLSSYRYRVPATIRKPTVGFRCVLASTRQQAEQLASAGRDAREKLLGSTSVSEGEVARMKQELLMKTSLTAEEKAAQAALTKEVLLNHPVMSGDDAEKAAARLLNDGQAAKAFTNSLGMRFLPLPRTSIKMGEREVRVKDHEAWMIATNREHEHKPTFTQTGEHPVVNITWQEASDFCAWLTARERGSHTIAAKAVYRLPTDTEWSLAVELPDEKGADAAARHLSDKSRFPWGTAWPPPILSANLDAARVESYSDNYQYTAPVGSFKPNALGFHDLGGNVSEWCGDAWPSLPGERVIRGGSWLNSEKNELFSSARQHLKEAGFRADLGFRIVLVEAAP